MSISKGQFILSRHAHREMFNPNADNGLSEKGRAQAQTLKDQVSKLIEGQDVVIVSSPKIRCQETIEPLASALGLNTEIDSRLDTQLETESSADFKKRILGFSEWFRTELKKSDSIYVICSHGDWIPEFTKDFSGQKLDLSKGQFVIL